MLYFASPWLSCNYQFVLHMPSLFSFSPPSLWQPSKCSLYLWVCFCFVCSFICVLYIPHISEIMLYLSFSVWFTSLSTVSSRTNHVGLDWQDFILFYSQTIFYCIYVPIFYFSFFYTNSIYFFLFIECIGVTLVNKTIQVSGAQSQNTSSIRCTGCSPPQVRSLSINIKSVLIELCPLPPALPNPLPLSQHHTILHVHEFSLSLFCWIHPPSQPSPLPPTSHSCQPAIWVSFSFAC